MTRLTGTVDTVYGRLDEAALEQLQRSYDTIGLLEAVRSLDELTVSISGDAGLRDRFLRLHAMVHMLVNGASLCVLVDQESLPDLAEEIADQLQQAIQILESCVQQIAPLQQLRKDEQIPFADPD